MKILVPTKRVCDTDQKIRVRADGLGIDDENLPHVVNPFDAIAVEEAVRIRERAADSVESIESGESGESVQIVAVGIGGEDYEDTLRTALATGADRAVRVACDEALDPWNVARVLREIVLRERPDLVLMGKQAVDDDSNQTGQFLAALLDWPQATFASRIELLDNAARVARETDAGIETVRVRMPAVITTDLRLNQPRYASLPSIMRARKKAIEVATLEELQVEIQPRVEVLHVEAATTGRSCVRVADVAELVMRLRDEAKVI